MSTQTALRATTTPRVNLLPPEIAEELRFRSLRAVMVLVLLFAVFVAGALYWQSSGEVSAAQQQLDSAKSDSIGLQQKASKLSNVPVVYAQVAAADGQLTVAMGSEVRYSYVLNDLSLSINRNVWLTSMAVIQNDVTAGIAADGAAAPVQGAVWTKPAIAKVTFAGRALSYSDVAAWLDFLSAGKNYSDPFVSAANASDPIGRTKTFTFMSSVNLTDKAYSHRYDTEVN